MGNKSGSEFGSIMIRTENLNILLGMLSKEISTFILQYQVIMEMLFNFKLQEKRKLSGQVDKNKAEGHIMEKSIPQRHFCYSYFLDQNLMVGQFVFPLNYIFHQICQDLLSLGTAFWQALIIRSRLEQDQLLNQLMTSSINKILSFENQLKKFYKVLQNKRLLIQRHGAVKTRSKMTLNIVFDNICISRENLYFAGEFVQITYDIDNSDCNLNIENIDVNIVNRITLKSNSGAQFVRDYPLNGLKIQPAGSIGCSIEVINTKTPGFVLTPSTTGNLVNSIYYVKIIPNFEGCTCCSSSPILLVPITLSAVLPNDYQEPIAQPENWQPQAFQSMIIKSDSTNPFNSKNSNLKNMVNPMNS